MKKYIIILTLALAGLLMSCNADEFLNRFPYDNPTAEQPMTMLLIENLVTGVYQVLTFDCFAAGQWAPVYMFFDVLSDNHFPGGGGSDDQPQLQAAAVFNASPTTNVNDGWWQIFFSGVQRANTALVAIENATQETIDRHYYTLQGRRAELLTLRAYYLMWLWKAYGNIPIPFFDRTGTLNDISASNWATPMSVPQQTVSSALAFMLQDLDEAVNTPATGTGGAVIFPDVRPRGNHADRGRVHRAMAKMTRARILLHADGMIGVNDAAGNAFITPEVATMVQGRLPQVLIDMQWVMNQSQFGLVTTGGTAFVGLPTGITHVANPFEWIFLGNEPTTAAGSIAGGGEFSSESVFEVFSNTSNGRGWGTPWATAGNYTPTFAGPRGGMVIPAAYAHLGQGGWGFMTVRPDAYAIFSQDDRRRTVSVIDWASIVDNYRFDQGFQNTGLWQGKYTIRTGNNAGTGGERLLNWANNRRIYRIAEAYLIAAELSYRLTGAGAALPFVNAVRSRAGIDPLPAVTMSDIKLEWRKEFFGEGLRFWQLLRWGQCENGRPLTEVLGNSPTFNFTFTNAQGETETVTIAQQRTWPANNRARLLPIPHSNIEQTSGGEHELRQNPGY